MDQDGMKYSLKDVDNSESENRRVLKTYLKCSAMYLLKPSKPNTAEQGTKNKVKGTRNEGTRNEEFAMADEVRERV